MMIGEPNVRTIAVWVAMRAKKEREREPTYLVCLGCRFIDGVDPSLDITYVICAQVMRLTAILDQPDHVVWLTEFICQRGTKTL